jgi:molecular chaperone DnaK (HSP70)
LIKKIKYDKIITIYNIKINMSENLRDYSKQELENTIDEDGKFLNINEQFKKALENRKITEEEYNFLTKRLKEEKDSLTNETKTKLSKFLGDIKTQVEST